MQAATPRHGHATRSSTKANSPPPPKRPTALTATVTPEACIQDTVHEDNPTPKSSPHPDDTTCNRESDYGTESEEEALPTVQPQARTSIGHLGFGTGNGSTVSNCTPPSWSTYTLDRAIAIQKKEGVVEHTQPTTPLIPVTVPVEMESNDEYLLNYKVRPFPPQYYVPLSRSF